jgi:hypothetical protein
MTDRNQLSKAGEWISTAVANNPEGLLLLAAGGVLLMRRSGAARGSMGLPKRAQEQISKATESLFDQAGDVTDSIASSTSDYARSAGRAASDGSARIMRQAQETLGSGLHRALRDQPLLVALGGLAAGAAIAAILPRSDLEQQALGPIGEQIGEEVSRVGDQVKQTATKAASTLRTAVRENGLDPDGIKKAVSEVTEVVRDGIKGEPQGHGRSSSGPDDWRQGR